MRKKCERVTGKFRQCPGRAPEEMASTREETDEEAVRGAGNGGVGLYYHPPPSLCSGIVPTGSTLIWLHDQHTTHMHFEGGVVALPSGGGGEAGSFQSEIQSEFQRTFSSPWNTDGNGGFPF
jgi:hypothetical protein